MKEIKTAEDMQLKLWTVEVELKDGRSKGLTNAPLHVVVNWMLSHGILSDLTSFIVSNSLNTFTNFDLD